MLDDAIKKGDDEMSDTIMRMRVHCLTCASCPGCGWCNDYSLASRASETRIHDMDALARKLNQADQHDDLLADMRAFAIEYANLSLARQLGQDELVADRLMEEADAALARQLAGILMEEADAALAREFGQKELVADRLMEEADAALARQLHHADLVAAGEI